MTELTTAELTTAELTELRLRSDALLSISTAPRAAFVIGARAYKGVFADPATKPLEERIRQLAQQRDAEAEHRRAEQAAKVEALEDLEEAEARATNLEKALSTVNIQAAEQNEHLAHLRRQGQRARGTMSGMQQKIAKQAKELARLTEENLQLKDKIVYLTKPGVVEVPSAEVLNQHPNPAKDRGLREFVVTTLAQYYPTGSKAVRFGAALKYLKEVDDIQAAQQALIAAMGDVSNSRVYYSFLTGGTDGLPF